MASCMPRLASDVTLGLCAAEGDDSGESPCRLGVERPSVTESERKAHIVRFGQRYKDRTKLTARAQSASEASSCLTSVNRNGRPAASPYFRPLM